jgi:hypothetical protein
VLASVRDFARIAWFWLHKGRWNDTELLPAHYFDRYRRPQVASSLPATYAPHEAGDYLGVGTFGGDSDQTPHGPGIYGFGWWLNGWSEGHAGLTWPAAPADTFQANGHFGAEVVTVIPSRHLVLVHRGGTNVGFEPGSASSLQNEVLEHLAAAVRPRPFVSLEKTPAGLALRWTDGCEGTDYAVYAGTLGDWYEHVPVVCTDHGADATEPLPPSAEDQYYLVVPHAGGVEGSYGPDGHGEPIPASDEPCFPDQQTGICG